MEECSSRRSSGGFSISRREPSHVLRDSAENNRDQNVQVCSRVGCSSRLNSMKYSSIGSPGKVTSSKTTFSSPARKKEISENSYKTVASPINLRKSFSDLKKKLPSNCDTDSETCSLLDESVEQAGKTRMRVRPETGNHHYSAEATTSEAGRSSVGPTTRSMKNTQRFGLRREDSASRSSASVSLKQANEGRRNDGSSTSKYNLRKFKCNSIPDVVSSGSSASSAESSHRRRRDTSGRKKTGEDESKKLNGTMQDVRRIDYINRGISISESGHTRNPGTSNAGSVRTRGLSARTRLSNHENRERLPLVELPRIRPPSPEPEISIDETDFEMGNQFSGQIPSIFMSSYSRSGSGSEHIRPNRSLGPCDVGAARSFMNRDSLRQYNLDGIAEMFLALERIEQEGEPTYEQLLFLETNLFLGRLAFNDQHRDLRMDIDDMSYEELLALEERMGSVSTAVPEEVLDKCLKRSIYQAIADCRENADDVKCSICQEEYVDGQEVGRLSCKHKYHVECINQWLRLKNWCPICKASAAPSPSASPPS
ncbi:uncharacterized protein LOC130797802 isoform X2 [Amaranthus tricolor]|nr:uncharacterized protein LOC130797802 isoform X2 [Amaranthus tricolor]XP_057516545.1 uncharacterized protein LOC130797802 isoform X2 [Amaranthus tricolor]XP_057516546.1 uncharacterized protein LOC130797802 isoform X2 [Amaranthus tricolor]XP_057516547.1 uncharacterized protein LOC130797802 isoform X2 [Amaranthus tricolor]XP_057516548.1 uncharacterized protein LOC130797802 isoform X2 [Amaranthus tricolor]